jgi:hypothetical protein
MRRIPAVLAVTVFLGAVTACDSASKQPALCSALGDSEGRIRVSCFNQYEDSRFDTRASFSQVIAGTSGLVERWQYGEALHFTDFNGDERLDLCRAAGNAEGQVEVTCYNRKGDGSFSDAASFHQTLTGTTGWTGDWQYGEALHFTDFNGDGRVDLCSARGNAEGFLDVACFQRNAEGNFPEAPSFAQTLTGKGGWVDRWQYGEPLHFVDVNRDGRVDLCGAQGDAEASGQLHLYCFHRDAEGRFPEALSFEQRFARGWSNRYQYGEALHYTDIDGDGLVDVCGARGMPPTGYLQVGCFYGKEDGTFITPAGFMQLLTESTQWTGDWQYGESLHFLRPER